MINFKELALNNKSLTDEQYEEYLEENMMKAIYFSEALVNGLVKINDINYFTRSSRWEFKDPQCFQLETTFYVFGIIPKQYICLIIEYYELKMHLGEKYIIGDYDMLLNIEIKKELIPLLECGIISF